MTNVIQRQVDCSSADEFLKALSPLGSFFKDVDPYETWLFRGQGADWPLIPSAFRDDRRLAALACRNIDNDEHRLLAERDLLIDFFEIADKRGLILPDDSQELRSRLETLRSTRGDHLVGLGSDGWRAANLVLSLTALAQHYGIPTRLLDWTRRSFIAAFFAAEDAWNLSGQTTAPSDKLVVWAFYFPLFGKHDDISRGTDPIRIVTAPSATNRNLQAQQGVFTLLNSLWVEDKFGSMEYLFEERAKSISGEETPVEWLLSHCRLRKFTLPRSEALRLLYLLAKVDITPSSVYPGYRSILTDLELRREWASFHLQDGG